MLLMQVIQVFHCRELLLLKGIASQGFGNWKKIAEHVGTRTKEEVEQHYNSIYVDSPDWPLPVSLLFNENLVFKPKLLQKMDRVFDIDPSEFQARKRRRISEMNATAPPPLKPAPVSLPGIHEIATFLPGRLEFEHELDNEAEDLVKDLEFGICLDYGGDEMVEDENDLDVRARAKWLEDKKNGVTPNNVTGKNTYSGKGPMPVNGLVNGKTNGYHQRSEHSGSQSDVQPKSEERDVVMTNGVNGAADDENAIEEPTQPPPMETNDSLTFKLNLIEMYGNRIEKRMENKAIMFDRGLLDYKKVCQ